MKRLFEIVTAGFVLAVFLMGCGQPKYRLDGNAQMQSVVLADSLTGQAVDSLKTEYRHLLDLLAKAEAAAVDSMRKSASSLEPSIKRAQRQLRSAQNKYKATFARMQQFRSFGGNPIFSDEDRNVSTKKLQSDILGRFYKGRAFSLETQGKMRSFIRSELVPLEKAVNQARSRLNRLRRSQAGRSQSTGEIAIQYKKKRMALTLDINRSINKTIWNHQLLNVKPDSSGAFVFEKTPAGRYHLFGMTADSLGYLAPLSVSAHTRQDVVPNPQFATRLMMPSDSASVE